MEKNKLALLPLAVGLALLVCSWLLSYPISIKFIGDIVFNHVPIFYWLSLPLILGSLYMMGVFSKRNSLRCAASIGLLLAIYSISYFFFSLPTGDSQYFAGLAQNFIHTKSLDPTQLVHEYYQWPSFFLLAYITTAVSGFSVNTFDFLLYAVIGFLLAATLYVYASKIYKNGAFLAVAAFFIAMFYFLNYQAVPFSLALVLLFILFMLETRKKSAPIILTMAILFFGISIAHSFVGLFFIIYLMYRCIIGRSKLYAELFAVTTSIFLLTQFTLGSYWMGFNIANLLRLPTDYGSIVTATLITNSAPVPIDMMAQTFSRVVTLLVILACALGFILMLIKRRLRALDAAIFLAGVTYSVVGLGLSSLGARAISILFVPLSLGATYLFQTKYKSYFAALFLILVICFVSVPIHYSFNSNYPTTFQTKEHLFLADFMLEKYNWAPRSLVITDDGLSYYLFTQIQGKAIIDSSHAPGLGLKGITNYDCIIYSVDLANDLQNSGISSENVSQQVSQRFSIVYNSGSSYVALSK